ncbi:MAG: DUF2333 family protein [Patescibacteria group bacterium]|nr:DUF2333 family protein [Patescibacteria group bacterium]
MLNTYKNFLKLCNFNCYIEEFDSKSTIVADDRPWFEKVHDWWDERKEEKEQRKNRGDDDLDIGEMSKNQKIIAAVIGFIFLNFLIVGSLNIVTDRNFDNINTKFEVDLSSKKLKTYLSNSQKGELLTQAIYNQLNRELHTPLGWSVNDIYITKYLDNRKNRQKGILFATRMLSIFYSTRLSKLGMTDNENKNLKTAREKELPYGADVWGFFVMSAEGKYIDAINNMKTYEKDLLADKATFNMRSDDVYELLRLITGPQLIDQTMGYLIQKNEEVAFNDLDDRMYYAQGVALVIRDVMHALIKIEPSILEKGGKRNISEGLSELDKIVKFNPIFVLRGQHDSMFADHRGKVARYLISIDKRIEELMESIRR